MGVGTEAEEEGFGCEGGMVRDGGVGLEGDVWSRKGDEKRPWCFVSQLSDLRLVLLDLGGSELMA